MEIAIREAAPDDFPAIVDLVNLVLPPEERTTLDEFRTSEGLRDPRDILHRALALDASRAAAVSTCGNSHLRPPHKFQLYIAVHPDYRRQGIGTKLEGRQRSFAAEHRGTELTAIIREDDTGSRAFLEHLGYREAYQRFEMELDVTTFDWSRYGRWREKLGDLRLFTFSEVMVGQENHMRLFELVKLLSADVPHPEGAPDFSFEDLGRFAMTPGFRADALFLLAEGERWIGLSGLLCLEGRPAYTYFTGVRRDYRGRGMATILKLATIEYARDHAISRMRTNNDTVNYPMVAVNEQLGYRRLPARVTMKLSW